MEKYHKYTLTGFSYPSTLTTNFTYSKLLLSWSNAIEKEAIISSFLKIITDFSACQISSVNDFLMKTYN